MTARKHPDEPRKRSGPPTKLTPEVQQLIIQAVSIGAPYELAALYAGVERTSIWRWLQRGDEEDEGIFHDFAVKVHEAEGKAAVGCLVRIKDAATREWQAAAWLMERRYPAMFGRSEARMVHEIQGPGGGPVKILHGHVDMAKLLQDPEAMKAYVLLEASARRAAPTGGDEPDVEPGGAG